MKFILGNKLGMTQVWKGDNLIAITQIKITPSVVVQIKNQEKDGYSAVQVGFGKKKEKNLKKPQKGHLGKTGDAKYFSDFSKILKEFRIESEEAGKLKVGDVISIDTFNAGDTVKVTGTSKGKGYQGVVKRYGFKGAPASHGTKDQLRMPGSSASIRLGKIPLGKRMGGRMGGDKVTLRGLEIINVDKENNIISIKGALPGSVNSLVAIIGDGELNIVKKQEVIETPAPVAVEAQNENNAEALKE